jgi:hypothetical protein
MTQADIGGGRQIALVGFAPFCRTASVKNRTVAQMGRVGTSSPTGRPSHGCTAK